MYMPWLTRWSSTMCTCVPCASTWRLARASCSSESPIFSATWCRPAVESVAGNGVIADLDQCDVVMRGPRREERHRSLAEVSSCDFVKTEYTAVEAEGAIEISDFQHDVSNLGDVD
jgi:hypothetical protein